MSLCPQVPEPCDGEKAKIIALAIVVPASVFDRTGNRLVGGGNSECERRLGQPGVGDKAIVGQPVILSWIGFGIVQAGPKPAAHIIIPSFGIAGPIPMVQNPFCLGILSVAMLEAVKTRRLPE